MRARPRTILAALVAVASLGAVSTPGNAAPILPVGAGTWSSTNVTQTPPCKGINSSTTDCEVDADSTQLVPAVETCNNATYVITTPVIIGTNFGCHVHFHADLRLTGSGTDVTVGPNEGTEVEIEVGACAGVTLSGPYVDVNDGAAGNYRVFPKVVVTNAGWKIQGNLVGVNVSTQAVVVLNVVGTITPGCKKVRLRNGSTNVTFSGVFKGSYQFL